MIPKDIYAAYETSDRETWEDTTDYGLIVGARETNDYIMLGKNGWNIEEEHIREYHIDPKYLGKTAWFVGKRHIVQWYQLPSEFLMEEAKRRYPVGTVFNNQNISVDYASSD